MMEYMALSQPNKYPATASMMALKIKMVPKASRSCFCAMYMAMKSVPPVVASARRHRLLPKA